MDNPTSIDVYNLEFRDGCHEMTIAGYHFTRAPDYRNRLQQLQHSITSCGGEITITATTGTHCVTARVTPPSPEPDSIIPWTGQNGTALDDILLLLSIFTTRHVFVERPPRSNPDRQPVIIADPRKFPWGGLIATSIPYIKSPATGDEDIVNHEWDCDIGPETHLNEIYQLMLTSDWQVKYRNGYYLILFGEALKQRTVESAFVNCWTIWEHLFSILNDSRMTEKTIRNIRPLEKIAYLLATYAVRENLQEKEKKRLKTLADIRNRLVHDGQFPEQDSVCEDAILFVRMTEFIVAKTLGLTPSKGFNTIERFESFLDSSTKRIAGSRSGNVRTLG